ncbi:MAG: restriction endonuclease [Eubacteriales bacterium]
MSSIKYMERQNFESLFGMSSGYVIDFKNREFQEFVFECVKVDIYKIYPDLSKAKILRALLQDLDNVNAGKLLLCLLEYFQSKRFIDDSNREIFYKCVQIGNRLIGKMESKEVKFKTPPVPDEKNNEAFDYDKNKTEIHKLANLDDTPQKRGYAFESYLCQLFSDCGLDPRGSFKITGEQIDGSFVMDSEIYLLEAKWTNAQQSKDDLVVFNEKVTSKSTFTRGLFISFAGFTENAVATFNSGRKPSIVLMTVQELVVSFERKIEFKSLLKKKIRALAEEGAVLKNVLN